MKQKVVLGAWLGLWTALAASCIMLVDPEQGQPGWQPPEFRKTVEFKAGGTITVEHTLGDISVSGWDKDSVEVVATGRASEPGKNRQVRLYTAGDLEPSVDVRQAEGALRIRTRSLGGPWSSGGLDYAVRVPDSVNLGPVRLERGNLAVSDVYGRVDVAVGTGGLTVKNFSGSLKATLGSGAADVELLDVHAEDVIQITTEDGDIVLRLQPGAGLRVEAEAPQGGISSDFDLGQRLPARSLTARLGDGTALAKLKALRGNIKILKTE